jgi:stage V sporulation protein G
MKITEVRIKLNESNHNPDIKATADITFESCFVVHGIKIIESPSKLYIIMPSKTFPDGETKEQVHPIDSEFRRYINDTIISKYLKIINAS